MVSFRARKVYVLELLVDDVAAVDGQGGALNEAGLCAAEEEHGVGHLLGGAHAGHGRDGDEGVVVRHVSCHWRPVRSQLCVKCRMWKRSHLMMPGQTQLTRMLYLAYYARQLSPSLAYAHLGCLHQRHHYESD